MPSVLQKKSYGSVTVFWLDREAAVEQLREAARRIGEERPEVRYIGLFGSLAEGRAVPGSDADLVVVVSASDRRPLDRPLDYLPFFDGFALDVDLFCYTAEEAEHSSFAASALRRSIPLWSRGA